ncbi:MAG TPA: type II toxin-antitoxin system PemK/MazF family toxin [Pirellulales bacterium]
MIRQGEIYWADSGFGRHPVIIVSREELNRGNSVLAVLVTSKRFETRSRLANCVAFSSGEFAFTENCVAQGDSLSRILANDLDLSLGAVATLDAARMRAVIRAIGYTIDSDCEPA